MPAGWNATDACSIIDKAEMAGVMGAGVSDGVLSMVHEPDQATVGVSECGYTLADGDRVSVLTRWSPVADNTPESIATTRSVMADTLKAAGGPQVEDLSGVGKAAFFVPKINQLDVFLDDARMLVLTLPTSLDAADAKEKGLALVATAN